MGHGQGVLARAALGTCPFTTLKKRAMKEAMEQLRCCGKGAKWESLLSVGDSDVERSAARFIGKECQCSGVIKWTKTVKFMERPDVYMLTSEVEALTERLSSIVKLPGNRSLGP